MSQRQTASKSRPASATAANNGLLAAASVSALLMAAPAIAWGQTAPSSEPEASVDQSDEIVVTAERRNQNLQDVPISATVLNAEALAERSVRDVGDLQRVAPSLAVTTVNRSTLINIRGVGMALTAPTSVPGVAFYIDGQFFPHEQLIRQSFYDFDSVEVLRGPQGTLTGQNSTGGAIYVRTPEPDFDGLSGYLDLTAGDYNRQRGVGALNFVIGRNVAVRIAGAHDEQDSFTTNIGPSPTNPGEYAQDSARFNVAFRSDDERLRLNLRGEYFDLDAGGTPTKNRVDAVSSDPFVIEEDAISYLTQEGYRLNAELRYSLTDGVDLRAFTSYEDAETEDQVDGDRTATAPPRPPNTNVGRVTLTNSYFTTRTNEIDLLSTGDGPFQWVVGAFTLNESVPFSILRDNFHTVSYVSATSNTTSTVRNESQSVFGQVSYAFTDRLEAFAGLRYSEDDQVYHRVSLTGVALTPANRTDNISSSSLTGRMGVNFHADPDSLLYLTVSRGYKGGGANALPGFPIEPETNLVYEAGFKLTRFDRHVTINGDVFYSDYRDIQLQGLVSGFPTQQNASRAQGYGAEIEATGRFGDFGFNAGASYLVNEFAESACLANSFNPAGSPLCPPGNDFVPEGRTLPYSPEWTANVALFYDFALGSAITLTPRVQWAHTSRQYSTSWPGQFTVLPEYDVVDARLSLDFGEAYTLEAFATNVLDETYIAGRVPDGSSSTGGTVYGAPRQYGVRLFYQF